MPPLEDMDRTDRATYWAKVGDTDQGNPIVAAGVGLDVRWVEGQQEAVDLRGDVIAYDATVGVAMNQIILVDSIMALGEPEDFAGTGYHELFQVKKILATKDLKGRFTKRTAVLQRFMGELPEIQ
jgi:hypothetical protein